LITEYCGGGNLASLLKSKGKFNEEFARLCLRQIAQGLSFLWMRSLIHRDLKPENILIQSRDQKYPILKIADFGFATELEESETLQQKFGTPLYMAPEVLLGPYDARVDLWSFGVIFYEMLTGKTPFDSSTIPEVRNKILDSTFEIPTPAKLSNEGATILQLLLQRDPDLRIRFEDLFCSEYLDLEHCPSPESLERGSQCLKAAVEYDSKQNFGNALACYQEGIAHLLAAMQYEEDEQIINTIRQKCQNYVARAEEIKLMKQVDLKVTPDFTIESSVKRSVGKISLILNPSPTNGKTLPKKKTPEEKAQLMIEQAKQEEAAHNFKEALQFYENAVGLLVMAIRAEKNEEKKKMLRKLASSYLDCAEELKKRIPGNQKRTPTAQNMITRSFSNPSNNNNNIPNTNNYHNTINNYNNNNNNNNNNTVNPNNNQQRFSKSETNLYPQLNNNPSSKNNPKNMNNVNKKGEQSLLGDMCIVQ